VRIGAQSPDSSLLLMDHVGYLDFPTLQSAQPAGLDVEQIEELRR
jgi:hypothetical protein